MSEMNIEDLQSKINQYKKVTHAVKEAQTNWQKSTKKLILSTLDEVISTTDLPWYTGINDEMFNNESVYLAFHDQPSGIQYNSKSASNAEHKNSGPLYKQGGSLNFSLLYNGRVLTWMSYPFIDDVIPPAELKVIKLYSIKSINASLIIDHIHLFLDEIILWESNFKKKVPSIGFRVPAIDQYEEE